MAILHTKMVNMAVSHKDWKLPKSPICMAEIDIDCSLDFHI